MEAEEEEPQIRHETHDAGASAGPSHTFFPDKSSSSPQAREEESLKVLRKTSGRRQFPRIWRATRGGKLLKIKQVHQA